MQLTITWWRDDQHALAAVLARQHVEHAAQAQDHVAPALAAGRPKIELADVRALLGELGILGADAERASAGRGCRTPSRAAARRPGLRRSARRRAAPPASTQVAPSRARARRASTGRPPAARSAACAANQRPSASRLLLAERRTAARRRRARRCRCRAGRGLRGIARDVAGALAVPHDPERLGPFLRGGGSPISRHALFSFQARPERLGKPRAHSAAG